MTDTTQSPGGATATAAGGGTGGAGMSRLWNRSLEHYPETGPRVVYLAIVVIATIMLYYELYVQSAVSPSIIHDYGMSFKFFVFVVVVSNAVGAFASLVAGLADRWGRANIVTVGLLATGLVTAFGLPNSGGKWPFAVLLAVLGFFEGIVLVATPALIRDFSPQLRRASAMGFWTMGPVVGSLVVTVVASHTLAAGSLPPWHNQFLICGLAGLGVFVIALFGLRELSPQLRDQLMVSSRDRVLIEAKAAGLDIEESLRKPWRQMLHLDIVASAIAISLFLFIYYTLVAFLVVYFQSVFSFSQAQSNALGNWMWGFDALGLVVFGLASDLLRVRKPFMVVGAVGAIVFSVLFGMDTHHLHTGYYTFAWQLALIAVFLGMAFTPWMASFTETVERRNPALTATGLAVWGWILRIIVAGLLAALPFVVTSATPLVNYGQQALAIQTKYPQAVATLGSLDPQTSNTLFHNATDPVALKTALAEVSAKLHVSQGQALNDLLAAKTALPAQDLAFLHAHGADVLAAQKRAPNEWRTWWWVCVGGEVAFIPLILLMAGRWSPAAAKRDEEEHERLIAEEMERLGVTAPA